MSSTTVQSFVDHPCPLDHPVYKILKCKYSDTLSREVNFHLEEGFDIVGQPFFHRSEVCQAVLLPASSE